MGKKPTASIVEELVKLEPHFNKQNAYALKFESECLFAKQQLMKQDYTLSAAQNKPEALRVAILNVAAIGISLNPALAHAYLVPRSPGKDDKGKAKPPQICLDISYRGLVKLATDSGAIKWAKAEVVYDDEPFEWVNIVSLPIHKLNPFGGKRAVGGVDGMIGGYCVAQLADGSYLLDHMSAADIWQVMNTSKAGGGPWKTWPLEMTKKTLVKRASKSWPQSGGRERLDLAVEVLSEHEGLHEEPTVARPSDFMRPTQEQTDTYLELAKGNAVDFWLWYRAQDERLKVSLPGCEFERGTKQKMMKYFEEQLTAGRLTLEAWSNDLSELCESGDDHGAAEFIAEFEGEQKAALLDLLSTEHRYFIEQLEKAA